MPPVGPTDRLAPLNMMYHSSAFGLCKKGQLERRPSHLARTMECKQVALVRPIVPK